MEVGPSLDRLPAEVVRNIFFYEGDIYTSNLTSAAYRRICRSWYYAIRNDVFDEHVIDEYETFGRAHRVFTALPYLFGFVQHLNSKLYPEDLKEQTLIVLITLFKCPNLVKLSLSDGACLPTINKYLERLTYLCIGSNGNDQAWTDILNYCKFTRFM